MENKNYKLGLDLGVASIGWAAVTDENTPQILAMGSRIIPLSTDDKDEFTKGKAISKNQKRTQKRTQRKGYDRYQLRRSNLNAILDKSGLKPDPELFKLTSVQLFGLRADAVSRKISLGELGRVLLHLNQKRGYKSSRSDANLDKKDTEYVAVVKGRHQLIHDKGLTIGQFFFSQLQDNPFARLKEQVFPREAYIEEFERICKEQQSHYPTLLTPEFVQQLRDEVIYYQRPLKSQKGLVSICEFEGKFRKNKEGKEVFTGPRVAPRSSPLFQVCKIWENINNLKIRNKRGQYYEITPQQKQKIFGYLDVSREMSEKKLFDLLGLKAADGWYGNKQTEKGIQGNTTKVALAAHLKSDSEYLDFPLEVVNKDSTDTETGEVLTRHVISENVEHLPLYRLWHTIYSIQDLDECANALTRNFGFDRDLANKLAAVDFTKAGFGNKSVRAMRNILPHLQAGLGYSDACSMAGYNHSNSQTRDERLTRELKDKLPPIPKNSLRQPIVEKILNQTVNLVNAIIDKYGKPSEIRIELARELKQSKDERKDAETAINKREKENKNISERIENEYRHLGVRATRNNIIKWRLFHEVSGDEAKVNASCIYCGRHFTLADALRGSEVDIEHIVPRSRLFDDSQSNKTLVHRKCNADKGDATAYDFMQSKGTEALENYIERVSQLFKNRLIGKTKRDRLLMPGDKIPQNFIDRQLRETQYIAGKAKQMLESICANVWSTTGGVTEYLRRLWGWDDVLMNLQLPRYRDVGLTEFQEWETPDGQVHKREVIKGWTKRDDHRHHAIDALVVACTRQGFIQRINTLNARHNRDEMYAEVSASGNNYKSGLTLLDRYMVGQRPFSTAQVEGAAAQILVSFKPGKRVAVKGVRKVKVGGRKKVVQSGIVIPRGVLSEESVYGRIQTIEKAKPVKYLFEHPELIFKPYIKALVDERLHKFNGDSRTALASLKNDPIYLDEQKTITLQYGTCYVQEYVIKYPIESIKAKDVDSIIDVRVRNIVRDRLAEFDNKEKEAFKDLENNPVWYNKEKGIKIRTVRCATGLSAVEPITKNTSGDAIGFVKPGNNHHIAIYKDESGKLREHVCTFWHAVERVKYGIDPVIKDPSSVWTSVLNDTSTYEESFLSKLPDDKWTFVESIQQNEMFLLGLQPIEIERATAEGNNELLSKHLYRVQKIAARNYCFRHHLETAIDDSKESAKALRFHIIQSFDAFSKLYPKKVIVSCLGGWRYI